MLCGDSPTAAPAAGKVLEIRKRPEESVLLELIVMSWHVLMKRNSEEGETRKTQGSRARTSAHKMQLQ